MPSSFQSIYKKSVLFHIASWIIFFIAPLLLSPPNEFNSILNDSGNLSSMALRNLILMGLFYLNFLYLIPVVLKNNSVGFYLLLIISAVLIVTFVNWQIHHFLADDFRRGFDGGPPPRPDEFGPPRNGFGPGPDQGGGRHPMMLAGPLFSSLLITIMVASISTSIALWKDWVKAKEAEQERAFQKVASELAVLKLQISPHFLFNTLNNIRWLVRSKSDQAEEAVVKLSQLLRYILYQTNLEKIGLDKEIQNLRDYVSLQQMRLTGHQNVVFEVNGAAENKMIVPLLFIPLVENVFKYGDFNGDFQNRIELTIDNDQLIFVTENMIVQSSAPVNKSESGIGLTNVKKRLGLHYPDKHSLVSTEQNGIFKLRLEIILN